RGTGSRPKPPGACASGPRACRTSQSSSACRAAPPPAPVRRERAARTVAPGAPPEPAPPRDGGHRAPPPRLPAPDPAPPALCRGLAPAEPVGAGAHETVAKTAALPVHTVYLNITPGGPMSVYAIAVFLHIVGALGLFAALALEWASLYNLRRVPTAGQAREWAKLLSALRFVGGPSALTILVTGIYMAATRWGGQGWIGAGLGGLVLIAVLGGAVS